MLLKKKKEQINSASVTLADKKSFKRRFMIAFNRDKELYLMCLLPLIFVFIFDYGPMYGIQIAFKRFSGAKGIWGSPWVGFEHFIRFLEAPQFWDILKNTLYLSIYSLIAGFPFPIILALLVNQVRNQKFKKTVQMMTYAPHFISIVVLCGMISVFLHPSTGIVNNVLKSFGFEPIFFLAKPEMFADIYVWSDIWQNTGWGMIIYLAALSSISPDLYEAAKIDGASRLKTIWYIELPSILPTIVTLFIMRTGKFMSLGFQKAFLLQNSLNIESSEIIATYVYKIGLLNGQFSYSAAIGLFNTIINVILVLSVNQISKKLSGSGLW